MLLIKLSNSTKSPIPLNSEQNQVQEQFAPVYHHIDARQKSRLISQIISLHRDSFVLLIESLAEEEQCGKAWGMVAAAFSAVLIPILQGKVRAAPALAGDVFLQPLPMMDILAFPGLAA